MPEATPTQRLVPIAVLLLLFVVSCGTRTGEIPFPGPDSVFPQPQTRAIHFTDPKTIQWVTAKAGIIKPILRKFDFRKLPTTTYEPSGFQPFAHAPVVTKINLNALPDSAFDMAKIAAHPLHFRTSILPPPVVTKTGLFALKAGSRLAIADIFAPLGLQGQYIIALIEDRAGMIWIGTDKALYRFDGEYLQHYSVAGVSGLLEDRSGKIWFVNTSGTGYLDLPHATLHFSTEVATVFPRVPRLMLDRKGRIWVSPLNNRRLRVIDPVTETYQQIDPTVGVPGAGIWSSCEDDQGRIWIVGAGAGLHIIDFAKGRIAHLRAAGGLPNDSLNAAYFDDRGNIWTGYKNGNIAKLELKTGSLTYYTGLPTDNAVLVYQFIFDEKGRAWVARNNGLVVIDPVNNLVNTPREEDGVPSDFILQVLRDKRRRTWVGTFARGAVLIDQDAEPVYQEQKRSVSAVLADSTGKLWLGTQTGGLTIQDPQKKTIASLGEEAGLQGVMVQAIVPVEDKIWLTSNRGIDVMDIARGTIEHTGKKEGLLNDTTYGAQKDSRGNLWIMGPSQGIEVVDSAKTIIRRISKANGLSSNNITYNREDGLGQMWIAPATGGIDIVDREQRTIRSFHDLPGLRDTCNKVMVPDQYGRMWIGTDKGIYVVDPKRNIVTILSTAEGLTDNYVSSLLLYHDHIIVGTHHRANIVNVPDPEKGSAEKWVVQTMAGTEGLTLNDQIWDVNTITKSGQYIWNDQGMTIIPEIKPEADSAVTYVTGLNVMNQARVFADRPAHKTGDSLWFGDSAYTHGAMPSQTGYVEGQGFHWDSVSGPYNLPVNCSIPYDQNYMQFQFAQNSLGRQEPVRYAYVLEGIDKHWSAFTAKTNTDTYLNLPPGEYTFKVSSERKTGLWTKPAVFHFWIAPPWWKTWWAYLIYVLVAGTLLRLFVQYRSKKLVRENRVLEERVEERTKEVKQQAEELATVNQISQALVSQAGLEDLIKLVGDQLRDLFHANIVYLALLEKKTKIIHFPYQHGDNMQPLKLGEGLTSKIIITGEPLLINQDVHELHTTLGIDHVGLPAASYLGVPIPVGDEIIGVLSIQSTETENRFAEKDKRLLGTIAANVGVAIRKARLFDEVKTANLDADAARKAAEEANAAKSAFLSTVSHELRTPLTSVLGFAKITKKRLEEKIFPITDRSDPKTQKTIDQISGNLSVVISEGERLTNLINDVLDLAKIEAGRMEWNMEPVQMTDVVDRAIAATSSLFDQKNLLLEKQMDSNLPEVSADRDKLIQVVVNLLSNAVKFTNTGAVTCRVFHKDNGIVVGITDTGIGIAPEDHTKVFEQFKQVGDTLTDKPKGTGLGLPICKEIVEHHGGRIWLESELGQGSTFYFMLPELAAKNGVAKPMQLNDLVRQLKKRMEIAHPSVSVNHNATILVVDDDEGIRSLLKQELTEAGYRVDEAVNGKDAIVKIRQKRPDLIILDVMMPEMNGFDVAAILKNDPVTMDIPIIILSVVQDKSRGFRIGIDRYLTKPIDTGLLFSEIGSLLEQGKSKKKVMVVDEDSVTARTLMEVLEAKGYQVVESDGKALVEKAIAAQPDIIILNSLLSDKQQIVQSLRFEKGLENVLFLIYQ